MNDPADPATLSTWASFTGRLPESLYRDAQDLALVFNLSLNEMLTEGIEGYVRSQLHESVIATAVERMRAAREVSEVGGSARARVKGGSGATPR